MAKYRLKVKLLAGSAAVLAGGVIFIKIINSTKGFS
jgi:hypothetical protein